VYRVAGHLALRRSRLDSRDDAPRATSTRSPRRPRRREPSRWPAGARERLLRERWPEAEADSLVQDILTATALGRRNFRHLRAPMQSAERRVPGVADC